MSQATNYALRASRRFRFAWSDFVSDIGDGAMATARLVVTFSGCVALVAGALVVTNESARGQLMTALLPAAIPFVSTAEAQVAVEEDIPPAPAPVKVVRVDPRQEPVIRYLARRYRVADEAARMLVTAAFEIGEQRKLDPLLILSVVAIESSLNPFAESAMGAQGLMQVMTRVHLERFEPHGGQLAALDPIANMKVGSAILHELISRGGSIERGLQLYVGAGNLPDDGGYGAKVLGERARLKLAASGKVDAAIAAALRPVAPPEPKTVTVEAEAAPFTPKSLTPSEAAGDGAPASSKRPEQSA
jgi:soluble lytic murein transglycosylase-like protein